MNSSNLAEQALEDTTPHLTVRRLLVDLRSGFDRHWTGDPFTSAYFNALSFSFPAGEQFFIDSVRAGAAALADTPENDAIKQLACDFVGQEATHRHLHGLYNAQLERQGLVNHWGPRIERRLKRGKELYFKDSRCPYMHELAITAAFEHFTSVLGDQTLSDADGPNDWLRQAQEPLRTLWRWHCAEESEHKAVAFDLYVKLGGNYQWRMRWYSYVLFQFLTDTARQTLHNLWRDGTLFQPRTLITGLRFVFGRHGFVRLYCKQLWAYTRRVFHPNQCGNPEQASRWLQDHADQWRAVAKTARA
ncbi:MAG: metal-dependent hydrolase [Alphaproteobacteria bacterium]|nr:metal-dependent hydrolase [Alphaproteobacteria bacterium]